MLTGDQIAEARQLSGIGTQKDLAKAAGVGRATLERAEQARSDVPKMGTDAMVKIVKALEAAGVEFFVEPGDTLVGQVRMRKKP